MRASVMKRLTCAVFVWSAAVTARGQGSLQPPDEALLGGAPVAVMKSLDQVEPRKVIMNLPYVISQPGSYYLASNLVGIAEAHGT